MTRPTAVLLVDDHTMFRQTLRLRLEREPDLTVVGDAATPLMPWPPSGPPCPMWS